MNGKSGSKRQLNVTEIVKRSYGLIQTLGVFLVMVIVMGLFLPRFLTFVNITNVLKQLAVNLVISAGMTCIILTGEFDISVGSVLALTASVAAWGMPKWGIFPAVVLGLLIGPVFGIFHGIIVTKGKIPSFITTLGTMMMARSLAFVVTDGKVLADIPESFKILGQGTIKGFPITLIVVIIVYLTVLNCVVFISTKSAIDLYTIIAIVMARGVINYTIRCFIQIYANTLTIKIT